MCIFVNNRSGSRTPRSIVARALRDSPFRRRDVIACAFITRGLLEAESVHELAISEALRKGQALEIPTPFGWTYPFFTPNMYMAVVDRVQPLRR